ncbi:MAG: hypothetical protein M1820_005620 [Bogoriella megaspora]|nr:MAG: hypothetical protein M1820_005620 [Bogoriella megaspora]
MLYAFGSNGSGQLGLGHLEDVSNPSTVPLPCPSEPDGLIKVVAGGNHTLLLFSNGAIFASGANPDGRCATSSKQYQHRIFCRSDALSHGESTNPSFILCAATWEASVLIDDNNNVYTCGTGNRGELGQGSGITSSSRPEILADFPPRGTRVTDLAASMGHVVAVISDGSVWGWGLGRKGQLGQPGVDRWTPHKIEGIPFHAMRAVCGKDFTFVAGAARDGRCQTLGLDKWNVISASPKTVAGWKDIDASWGTVYVVLETGGLLAWGRNDHHQVPSTSGPSINQVAAGSEHLLAVTTDAKSCIACGWGEHGNCGILQNCDNDAPVGGNEIKIDGKITNIGAGCATSWITTRSD